MEDVETPPSLPSRADAVLRATAAMLARACDAPCVLLLSEGEGLRARPTWLHGAPGAPTPGWIELDPELALACAGAEPVVTTDGPEVASPTWQALLLRSTASVPVPRERGRTWTRLVVGDTRARGFAADVVELVAGAATVMGAALDAERRRGSQAHVAALVRCALESSDLAVTMRRALAVVAEVLDVSIATVFRRLDRPGEFEVMADHEEGRLTAGTVVVLPPEFDVQQASRPTPTVEDWATETTLSRPDIAADLGIRAFATADLSVGGRSWGRLAIGSAAPRVFAGVDLALLQGIADILAAAIVRDEIEARLRDTAEAFQRALLPAHLPEVAGVEIAARYLPASGTLVGGDWFDVLDLPHGGVGLVIGDVEGHDSTAAAMMGQVRDLVRAYAGEGHGPAKIMNGINRFVAAHPSRLVTCCYVEVRPADHTLTGVRAGHPPPVVLAPDGTAGVLDLADGLVLGVDESATYRERTVLLAPGSMLVLATDGLLADEDDAREVAAELGGRDEPVVDLADALLAQCRPTPHPDDIAVLIARLTAPAPAPAEGGRQVRRVFGPFTESPAAARQFVHDVLTAWGSADVVDAGQLAASELVTNALIHTTSPATLVLRSPSSDHVWLGVGDESDRVVRLSDAASDDVSGRGLSIVSLLAADWGVDVVPGRGKTVWCTLTADA